MCLAPTITSYRRMMLSTIRMFPIREIKGELLQSAAVHLIFMPLATQLMLPMTLLFPAVLLTHILSPILLIRERSAIRVLLTYIFAFPHEAEAVADVPEVHQVHRIFRILPINTQQDLRYPTERIPGRLLRRTAQPETTCIILQKNRQAQVK